MWPVTYSLNVVLIIHNKIVSKYLNCAHQRNDPESAIQPIVFLSLKMVTRCLYFHSNHQWHFRGYGIDAHSKFLDCIVIVKLQL